MLVTDREIKELVIELDSADIISLKKGKTLTKKIEGSYGERDCILSMYSCDHTVEDDE
ncbi:MAG TPA: hypothetical protein VFG24_00105 [Nitrosopumilaceae archaeon]|nr:hypothetical protein [Nitrosopumilaceae archaeon]